MAGPRQEFASLLQRDERGRARLRVGCRRVLERRVLERGERKLVQGPGERQVSLVWGELLNQSSIKLQLSRQQPATRLILPAGQLTWNDRPVLTKRRGETGIQQQDRGCYATLPLSFFIRSGQASDDCPMPVRAPSSFGFSFDDHVRPLI